MIGYNKPLNSLTDTLPNLFKQHQGSSFKFTHMLNMFNGECLYMLYKLIMDMS